MLLRRITQHVKEQNWFAVADLTIRSFPRKRESSWKIRKTLDANPQNVTSCDIFLDPPFQGDERVGRPA